MRQFRLVAGLVLALGVFSLVPQLAQAHARYARSEPGADAVVATAPQQIRVWFTEEVRTSGSSLQVVDSAGNRVDTGDGHVDLNEPDRKLMWATLNPLADGAYTVNWVTISGQDGDQAEGSFRFGVGAGTVLMPRPPIGPLPTLSIASATVSGHTAMFHVHVDGATLGLGTSVDMDHRGMTTDGMDSGAMAQSPPLSMSGASVPEGHLHVYVDGTMVQMVYQPDVVLTDLPSGTHQVRVELSNNMHQDWDPPIEATLTVVVP